MPDCFHAKYRPPERRTEVLIGKFHSRGQAEDALKEHIANRGIDLGDNYIYQMQGYSIDVKPLRRTKKEVSEEKARKAEAKARQKKLFSDI